MGASLVNILLGGFKALFMNLTGVVLTYFIYKVFTKYTSVLINWGLAQLGQVDPNSTTVQLVGVGAWMADVMMLPQTIGLIISFLLVGFVIRMVRG